MPNDYHHGLSLTSSAKLGSSGSTLLAYHLALRSDAYYTRAMLIGYRT